MAKDNSTKSIKESLLTFFQNLVGTTKEQKEEFDNTMNEIKQRKPTKEKAYDLVIFLFCKNYLLMNKSNQKQVEVLSNRIENKKLSNTLDQQNEPTSMTPFGHSKKGDLK